MKISLLKYYASLLFLWIVLLSMPGCSNKKNTALSRGYNNLTAHYNVYYNGNEAFKAGVKKVEEAHQDNYSLLLPIYIYSDIEATRSSFGDMNRAIEKGAKCIRKHSITTKPKKNKKKFDEDQTEFVKWIDDSYLLIGKANFYKREFFPAIETFNYIIKEYSKQPIKYEAYIWLARSYTEMEKYKKAQDFLSMLEPDKDKIPENIVGPYNMTWADLMLRQKKYFEAIPYLEKGVENTKKKKEKLRYSYILAQVYQLLEDNKNAYLAYGKVIEHNPNYEMTFNARINRASIFNSSAGDSKALIKELQKMLKDDKNMDYRDQIFYALGNIAANENRIGEAIDFYILSTQNSTTNDNQKAISFLAIADIYFEQPNYNQAQIYYDSTITFLDKEYPDYTNIKRLSENLNDLVENLTIVSTEDSLQRIAKLPEAQRNAIIDGIIGRLIEAENREKELLAQQRQDLAYLEQSGNETQNQGGSWYFYNPSMMAMGQSEFKKKWGSRKLEDNWRRKNKEDMTWDALTEQSQTPSDSAAVVYSDKSREYYLVNLPLTDSAIQKSKIKVEEAYFNIATIYKEKFEDYPLSADSYLELLKNYPETPYRLQSYYNLYKVYMLSKDKVNAEIYKDKIIKEYPSSDYALILINPDYFKELDKIEKQINFLYQATYKYFLVDNCDEVNNNYHFADSAFPLSNLIPKFALLSTICTGHSGDTAYFKENLTAFKEQYPNTEEANYAQEVLDALDRKPREVELKEPEEQPVDDFAMGDQIDSIDYSMYKYAENTEYYFMVVVANEKIEPNRIKFNLQNFNIDYFSFLNFDVGDELISASFTSIDVKKFKNKKMASNYYESVFIAGEVFEGIEKNSYRAYIISTENYNKFIKDKNIPRYQKFFEVSYKSLLKK